MDRIETYRYLVTETEGRMSLRTELGQLFREGAPRSAMAVLQLKIDASYSRAESARAELAAQ